MKKFKAIIFDMDGVLVNSEPHYIRMDKEIFKTLGLTISNEEHLTFQGSATDHMWRVLKEKYGLKAPISELVEMSNNLNYPYFESLKTIDPMPGVKKLIKFLNRKEIPIAVASSAYPGIIDILLTKTNLKKYFKVVINSTMVEKSKPAPDIFLLAAKSLNMEPEECIVIEDSTNGIQAAKNAGMYCIAFAGPGSEIQDQSKADRIITQFEEIIQSLQVLF